MSELVQLLQQKTGMSQEMAQQVVNVVASHLKAKLPAPLAGNVDSFLGATGGGEQPAGEAPAEGGLMGEAKAMMAGLGGIMGNKES